MATTTGCWPEDLRGSRVFSSIDTSADIVMAATQPDPGNSPAPPADNERTRVPAVVTQSAPCNGRRSATTIVDKLFAWLSRFSLVLEESLLSLPRNSCPRARKRYGARRKNAFSLRRTGFMSEIRVSLGSKAY